MSTRSISLCTMVLVVLLGVYLNPSEAQAQVPDLLDINVTAKGGVSFSGVNKPGTKEFNGGRADITYPGFFGVGQMYGLFIEPRFTGLKIVELGLEIGFVYSQSTGSGDINEQDVTLKATDIIIPVHAKAAFALGLASFTVGLGADVLLPQSVEMDKPAGISNIKASERPSATYFGVQLGVEFEVPLVGIKIPLEFRGRFNPNMEDTYDSRLTIEGSGSNATIGYMPNWKFQGELMLGVGYAFNIL
jgi:hypothetical protein